jgi:hypothetical protein
MRRKYKGRVTAGWPKDMWPQVKLSAAYDTPVELRTKQQRELIAADERHAQRNADHVDGYDRDDLGESPDS